MLVLLAVILAVWAPCAFASSDVVQGYRLAGTVAVGNDYLAFLEIPSGAQVLVRKGDAVGAARVGDVRDREIDLILASRKLTISLQRSDQPTVSAPSREIVISQSSEEHVLRREVSVAPFGQAMAQPGAAPAGAPAGLSQRIAPVLDLPTHSQIVAVNGHAVSSSSLAIREISEVLAAGGTITMNLETPDGLKRVYVMPQQVEPTPLAP